MIARAYLSAFALILAAAPLGAQTIPAIPVRTLSAPTATTREPIFNVAGIKQLPDGRLVVNDPRRSRILLFDTTLTSYTLLLGSDSKDTPPTPTASPIIPYLGDSVLYVDIGARSFTVIEPSGRMGRTMAPPVDQAISSMNGPTSGAVDAHGNLIFKGMVYRTTRVDQATGRMITEPAPDSAPVLRANFDTRKVDTLGKVRIAFGSGSVMGRDAAGKETWTTTLNPSMPVIDEWCVLSDGTVALVRGRDYHVDWIDADGTRRSTPRMPMAWRRLTDDDKRMKLDSLHRLVDSLAATPRPMGMMLRGRPDMPGMDTLYAWILPTTSLDARGGLLYDVVNKKGEVFERVQLPKNRVIAGFGRGGIVYVMVRNPEGLIIERTRIER